MMIDEGTALHSGRRWRYFSVHNWGIAAGGAIHSDEWKGPGRTKRHNDSLIDKANLM